MEEQENELIEESYADIIRALKYISLTNEIDESITIKKELLSELALILGILKKEVTEKELYAAIKQTKNGAASLFQYQIITKNKKLGIKVELESKIMDVEGFPFEIFAGQNVNEIVDLYVKSK